ncbi:MAG: hypothetical protein MUF00_00805 [Gemmatimonadaceae bacterium]|nr:hypothetical protein [Gemmatimonadaceae bacterium]
MRTAVRTSPHGAVWCSLLLLAACGQGAATAAEPSAAAMSLSGEGRADAEAVRVVDSLLLTVSRDDVVQVARTSLPRDATALIGRNREWGTMAAARFQLGAGGALRTALRLRAEPDARAAFAGLEVALSTMEPSGRLPVTLPSSVTMGQTLSEGDVASGAAFFLGDACMGALALETYPSPDAVASRERRDALRERLTRAARWVRTLATPLLNADRRAPNRLLFDARTFLGCGWLADDAALRAEAAPFLAAWQSARTPDGWYREGSGWDTSYQAVSLELGGDVLPLITVTTDRARLADGLREGTRWLVGRVRADGRVDSSGNARTCGGGESFLGEPKRLSISSVVIGLARMAVAAVPSPDSAALDASRRVSTWARANPTVDPCFEG